MTRIAMSFGSLNPGGGEKQSCNLLIEFQKRGYEVHAVLPNGAGKMQGNLEPMLADMNISMHSGEQERDKTVALRRIFERIRPDITIHGGYPMSLHGAIAAFEAGVPRRIIRIESAGLVREQFPQEALFELTGHAAADWIVGNSQAVVDSFDLYHGICEHKRAIMPNGVHIPDMKGLRAPAREFWGYPDNSTVIIGHLANFRKDGVKNQLMLVRAAALVANEAQFRMVLCGYPSEYQKVVEDEIAALGLEGVVIIPGRLSELDMIAGWDIAVNASTTEGFSNAVQECMAYGLPVVATAVGGNVHAIEDGQTGLLVPSDDEQAMAETLLRLIKDSRLRKKIGKAARGYMADNFGWDVVIKQWEALF